MFYRIVISESLVSNVRRGSDSDVDSVSAGRAKSQLSCQLTRCSALSGKSEGIWKEGSANCWTGNFYRIKNSRQWLTIRDEIKGATFFSCMSWNTLADDICSFGDLYFSESLLFQRN